MLHRLALIATVLVCVLGSATLLACEDEVLGTTWVREPELEARLFNAFFRDARGTSPTFKKFGALNPDLLLAAYSLQLDPNEQGHAYRQIKERHIRELGIKESDVQKIAAGRFEASQLVPLIEKVFAPILSMQGLKDEIPEKLGNLNIGLVGLIEHFYEHRIGWVYMNDQASRGPYLVVSMNAYDPNDTNKIIPGRAIAIVILRRVPE